MLSTLKLALTNLRMALFPQHCVVCERRLTAGEHHICAACTINIPLTHYKAETGNPVERIFWGKIPIVSANAYMHYHPNTRYAAIIKSLKYHNNPGIGIYLGRSMAKELADTDFFSNIDCIIPVPLAKKRERQRGYNQAKCVAQGIEQITGIPTAEQHIRRSKNNPSQTTIQTHQRQENVANIFTLTTIPSLQHPLCNKHILLIDDIITTGSTILACAQTLATIPNLKISILSIGIAGHHGKGVPTTEE